MADGSDTDDGRARRGVTGVRGALREANAQFSELTGKTVETTTSVERTDGGWRVVFEVVELERIPPTTSVLATYEAELDKEGNLMNYRRVRRYYRNETDPA